MATDYISREAALKAICDKQRDHTHWKSNYELGKYQGANGYVEAIKSVPAVDVVEVVRCKDCIHAPLPGDCEGGSDMEWPKIDGIYEDCTCPHFCDDNWYSARPDPEEFCEKGERRADNGK